MNSAELSVYPVEIELSSRRPNLISIAPRDFIELASLWPTLVSIASWDFITTSEPMKA